MLLFEKPMHYRRANGGNIRIDLENNKLHFSVPVNIIQINFSYFQKQEIKVKEHRVKKESICEHAKV